MKNWHLSWLWERLFPFMPMPGANPVLVRKGGISHCTAGGKFVCNDGSISASKKTCTN